MKIEQGLRGTEDPAKALLSLEALYEETLRLQGVIECLVEKCKEKDDGR